MPPKYINLSMQSAGKIWEMDHTEGVPTVEIKIASVNYFFNFLWSRSYIFSISLSEILVSDSKEDSSGAGFPL